MSILRLDGRIEALSPICHFGDEKTGSTPILRSITHWDPGSGRHVRLPFISGNAIRGVLRRILMRDLFERVGYSNESTKLHHAVFTGGVLESTDDASGTLDLEFRRMVRDTIPPLGLLGTAIGNQMLPGCLVVEHAMPVCEEYAAYVPFDDPRKAHGVRTFTDTPFATRRDDLRAGREEDEQATQMLIEFEAFVAGTLFIHGFVLRHANALETACLGHALSLWEQEPYIGGKAGSGYGRVRATYEPTPDPEPYRSYLATEAEAVRGALADLAARLEGKRKKAE